MRQPERLAHPPHERLEDLVGAQRGRDLLENVEQQIAGAQRVPGLLHFPPGAEVGVDPGAQLAEMHGARHRVLGTGLEGIGHRVGPAVRHQHDHGGRREPGRGRQGAHRLGETGVPGTDGKDQQVRRGLVGPVGDRRGIRRLRDLESRTYQEALEAFRAGGGIADEEEARLDLLGQRRSRTFGGVSSYRSRYGTATAARGV